MTCAHVLGLIDAGPFANYPPAHLDTAGQHARQCATCGPALQAATALTTELAALSQPGASPDMAAAVMARIARAEQADATSGAGARHGTSDLSGTGDWSAGATALASLTAGVAVVLAAASGEPAAMMASPRWPGLTTGLLSMPAISVGAVVSAISLGLYAAGLFAPLGGKDSR